MARKWTEFGLGPKGSTQHRIHVSLSKEGNLRLNKMAFAELGSPDAVKLLFEERTGTIGLTPTSPAMPNAYSTQLQRKRRRHPLQLPYVPQNQRRQPGHLSNLPNRPRRRRRPAPRTKIPRPTA